MRSLLSGMTIAVMIASPVATAQNTGWVIHGHGVKSCGAYIAAKETQLPGQGQSLQYNGATWYGESFLFAQWIQGYISGVNSSDPNAVNQVQVDFAGVDLWLRNWCRTNPAKSVFIGMAEFMREQRRK